MKKTFYLIASLLLAGLIAAFIHSVWQTTAYIQNNSREGTLRIDRQYNASRWAEPLPLKKINTYTATLAPHYEVIVESDQELVAGRQYFIRFLTRDRTQGAPSSHLRPIPGTLRLRADDDGTPVKVEPTAVMDRLVKKAIGPLGPGQVETPAADLAIPGHGGGSVPFLIGGARDNLLELVWNNSSTGEWLALLIAGLALNVTAINALTLPWRPRISKVDDKDFVHPSLRKIDADLPPAPAPRIVFTPKVDAPAPDLAKPPATPVYTDPPLKLPRKSSKG